MIYFHTMENTKIRQEFANTLTHLAGILMFGALIPFLIIKGMQKEHLPYFWTILVFAFGLLMVYASSTLYHYVKKPALKNALRIWDHVSIYFLIGGTYTPLVAKFLPMQHSTLFLGILWSLIAVGVVFKLFFTGKYDIISTISYVALGWMALFIIRPMIEFAPPIVLTYIVIGGIAYTTGVIFYAWKRFTYHHAIWHVFVLAGSFTHFLAVQAAFS